MRTKTMFGGTFSILHWIVVLAVVLLLFGGRGKVSAIMGDFGKGLRNFKTGLKGPEEEAEEAEAIEAAPTPAAKKPTAKKAAPKKAAAKKATAKKASAKKAAKK
ncbi:MAG: twin-arginine translocase TatA/TatE family subunit [Candidatus Puniceispirillaceae bacterium]